MLIFINLLYNKHRSLFDFLSLFFLFVFISLDMIVPQRGVSRFIGCVRIGISICNANAQRRCKNWKWYMFQTSDLSVIRYCSVNDTGILGQKKDIYMPVFLTGFHDVQLFRLKCCRVLYKLMTKADQQLCLLRARYQRAFNQERVLLKLRI